MNGVSISDQFKFPVPANIDPAEPILVVEDQLDLRLIITHHLNKLNFQKVTHLGNGYEALEALVQLKKPATILCDMEMPVMGGLDLLAEMREKPEISRGPFCLMMDNVSKEKVMLAVETGIDDLINKPFTLGDLIPKLRSAFKNYHNPKNPEKVYEHAKTSLREGRLEDASKIYMLLSQTAQKAARPLVGLARTAIKQGKMDEALKFLQEAEARNPNYVHAFAVRGEVYAKMSDWNNAIDAFTKAINISPLNPVRYSSAVEILFKVNKYQESADLLATAEKHELNFPGIHHFHSQALFMLKDFKGAAKHIRRALSSDQKNVVYLNQLGICQKEAGEFDEAQKTYNAVIKIDPDNKSALYNKAIMLAVKGDPNEAIKLLERVLKKYPDFTNAKSKLDEIKNSPGNATGKQPAA